MHRSSLPLAAVRSCRRPSHPLPQPLQAKQQQEAEWEREFVAGSSRSRTPSLQYCRITAPSAAPSPGSSRLTGVEETHSPSEAGAPSAASPAWLRKLTSTWDDLPARYKMVFATSMAFVVCNMVRARSFPTADSSYTGALAVLCCPCYTQWLKAANT